MNEKDRQFNRTACAVVNGASVDALNSTMAMLK